MRWAIVRRRYDACGGAELYVDRLLAALAADGRLPELIAESWSEPPPGIRLHCVPVRGGRAARLDGFIRGATRLIERERFDRVFSLERGVAADVYRAGDGVHAVWLRHWRSWGRWWKRAFAGRGRFHAAMKRADAVSLDPARTGRVIVNSEMVRREISGRFQFPRDRIHLIRNGVELDQLRSGDRRRLRDSWSVPDNVCLLLFAGSGWERKGLAWLRKALARMPRDRFALVVAGRGRPPGNRATNESYVGALPRIEMPDAYAAADVLVLPTLYDPSANVCTEALAAGLPVVTTSQNGAAELIEAGVNGHVIAAPTDTQALVAATVYWAEHPNLRPVPTPQDIALDRNVRETLDLLTMSALPRRS
jgi:UDP-glucose:(heptosyl)LPS alpha-1,3-glucosyltransferase